MVGKHHIFVGIARASICLVPTLALVALFTGCGGTAPTAGTQTTGTGTTTDEQVLLDDPLSFDGTVSGKLVESESTRSSTADTSAAQAVPPTFDTTNACVRFRDLAGNDLLDPNGVPIGEVPLNPDGSFTADGLPVGVDFTVCGDLDKDGSCEVESCVQIPADDTGDTGHLDDIQTDPLTTMVLAKLRRSIDERGVDFEKLPVSPATIVARIVDAYTHLFEESGLDLEIDLEDIEDLSLEELAELFSQFIPAVARQSMDIAEGNMELARADVADLDAVVVGIAEIFLRAGFPIQDFPGNPDLSTLANLDNVDVTTARELFGDFGAFEDFPEPDGKFDEAMLGDIPPELLALLPPDWDGTLESLSDEDIALLFPGGIPDDPSILLAEAGTDLPPEGDLVEPIVYVSTVTEPDRNFANAEGQDGGGIGPHLPVLNDHLLLEMARLHVANREITLGNLYELLTSIDNGLGIRLTYDVFDPNFFGPPLSIFETADGRGKAIDLQSIFRAVFEGGFGEVDFESFEQKEADLRALLGDLLAGTIAPTFERLFGAIINDRIVGIDAISTTIREARAHLPFSRSGPSAFFVVADGDAFNGADTVSAVTVDAVITIDGLVTSVTFNASGAGAYFLGFTESTDSDGNVELIVRETGSPMHGPHGPVRLNINDDGIFQAVNGAPFAALVSELGAFYPGISISVTKDDFVPESFDEELRIAEAGDDFVDGPNEQLFVLATSIGIDAEPVRVNYDELSGQVTYDPNGRNLLMFLPDSPETGLFALFNEDTGRTASHDDPDFFFDAPQELPENFEDFFNEFDDTQTFDDFEEIDQVFDDFFIDELTEEELLLLDGEVPLTDEELLLLEGEVPLTDEELLLLEGQVPLTDEELLLLEEQLPPPDPIVDPTPAQVVDETTTDVVVEEVLLDPILDDPALVDGTIEDPIFHEPGFREPGFILVAAEEIVGLPIGKETFNFVFGTDVPNASYDSSGDPFFDDINGDGMHGTDEPTAQFRPTLFDLSDWRSTDLRLYYRRVDNNASVRFEEIDFESATPATLDGVALVARNYVPRLNAFKFGRPNSAINLLTAFLPPSFLNGTNGLTRETKVDILSAIAIINLIMDQLHNVEANIDPDGFGPLAPERFLADAHLFTAPLNDPFVLVLDGFRSRSVVKDGAPEGATDSAQ